MLKYIKFFLRFSKLYLILLVAASVVLGWRAAHIRFDFSIESLFRTGSPERADYDWFQKNFGSDDSVIFVAFKAPDVLNPTMRTYIGHLSSRLGAVGGVRAVFTIKDAFDFAKESIEQQRISGGLKPGQLEERLQKEIRDNPLFRGNVISADGRTTGLWVVLQPDVVEQERRAAVLAEVRRVLEEEERSSGLRFHVAGIPVIENEYVSLTKRDIVTFLPLAVAVFLLLLCIYFRNVPGVVLPLATVGIAIVWTVGLMQIFGLKFSILSSLVPNLILIVGIADSIHILSHYREVGLQYPDKREAVARTILTMIPACFLTSFTTAVGFASLATTNVYIVQEFGIVTACGIMIAYNITIHFLPSALDNLPPLRGRMLDQFAHQFSDRVMDGIARVSDRRRWWVFGVAAALVAVSGAGMLRIRRESSWLQDLRTDNPVHQAHAFFEGNLTPVITVDLVLRTKRPGGMNEMEALDDAEALERYIRAWKHPQRPDARVTQTLSYTDLLRELNRIRRLREAFRNRDLSTLMLVDGAGLRTLPSTKQHLDECLELYRGFTKDHDLVARLTDDPLTSSRISVRISNVNSVVVDDFVRDVQREHAKYAQRFDLVPTGKSWLAKRAMDSVINNMISSLGIAALIIFGSMSILFRSLKVGLLSIIPNVLPMVFVAGLMGWLGIPLNFSTITIFSIALGIAVDTTIHYLSRLRLEVPLDGDHTAAMYRTLRGAGRPMIFSTMLLVLGFGSILTSSFKFTFYFGLLGGVAILSALLCDLFVTPALMLTFKPAVGRWEKLEKKLKDLGQKLTEMLEKRGAKLE